MTERGAQGGFSIVEVLVAIVILTAAIVPMVSMFDSALKATRSGGDYDSARALANRSMEQLRALDYRKVVERYGPGRSTACPGDAPGDKFDCEVKTGFVDENLLPGAESRSRLEVAVAVRWDGKVYETRGLLAAGSP